ncbi:MAG: beta-lactamase family protein [Phycisphaerales bacterium]|nr:MAG: beta-lactamase family protein [Phycisphaerales bacterium]
MKWNLVTEECFTSSANSSLHTRCHVERSTAQSRHLAAKARRAEYATRFLRAGFALGRNDSVDARRHAGLIAVLLALLVCLSLSCRVDRGRDLHLEQIDAVVTEEIAAGRFPGAVVLVGRANRTLYCKAFGLAVGEPFQQSMQKDTVFDLASLTKPIATATSIMILIDRDRLDPNDLVGDYLPDFACSGKEDVRIKHLLTHTSGLPAYTNAAALESQYGNPCPDEVLEKICGLEAQSQPGETFQYSCLGYITLAEIVRVISGQHIAAFSQANVFTPLTMKDTRFNPPASWQNRIAATEIVDDELLRGTVHDPLARLRAGTSGNAGLFSTASDLAIYCRMLLNHGKWRGGRILSPTATEMLTTAQSHGRAFGFDVLSSYSWIKGPSASEETFCHSGYTGTSLVCDPASKTYLIILTNRAHPSDEGTVRPVRQRIAEIVFPPKVTSPES